MKAPARGIALALLTVLLFHAHRADASKLVLALFPPEIDSAASDNVLMPAVPILEKAMKGQLDERFDVRPVVFQEDPAATSGERRREKARSIGASYTVTGTVSRIGKGVTLDVTLAPVEDLGKGRTVVVSGILEDASPASAQYFGEFQRLGIDAARKLNELFFGAGGKAAAEGARAVPGLSGTISRSASLPGQVVSVAMSDLDRDGKMEVAAAYASEIAIYGLDGNDLKEEARISDAGSGLFHVDARDIDRDGVAEIVAVRFMGRKAVSGIWRYDGEGYRKITPDLPFLLRIVDLGPEGIVLVGQESDPDKIYSGPILRMALQPSGSVEVKGSEQAALPLPEGTFIYGFIPLRRMKEKEIRYAVLSSRDRLVYLDSAGKELWEGLDSFSGTEFRLGEVEGKVQLPPRMTAVDLNQDGNDEVVVMNVLVSAGTFFESLRVATQSELVCFSQGNDSLQLAWRSPQTDTSAQDLLTDSRRPGFPSFGLASRDRGKILGGATQWRVLWMK
ncbi:MAG: VCBS repeat-containing protein [Deltaproteobacteria bacterium]|nr:VCBS repeat-containing protein [Deltaproteobacteria bacterium]